jgi:hypothetical protein
MIRQYLLQPLCGAARLMREPKREGVNVAHFPSRNGSSQDGSSCRIEARLRWRHQLCFRQRQEHQTLGCMGQREVRIG